MPFILICSLDKWIDDARKDGEILPQLKDYYEKKCSQLDYYLGWKPERLCQSFVGRTDKVIIMQSAGRCISIHLSKQLGKV